VTGSYVKYNNDLDWTEDKRNTPQAFSHWTYIQSEKQLMIVDIQVLCCASRLHRNAQADICFPPQRESGDVWTDPQFHTSYATADFGKGNLEQMGIDGFFKSHKCNSICEYLGIGKVWFLLIWLVHFAITAPTFIDTLLRTQKLVWAQWRLHGHLIAVRGVQESLV